MEKIKAKFTHQYLFDLSPKWYKTFWANKYGFSKNDYSKMEREVRLLPYFLNPDSVFIDIGSNLGLYLYWAEKLQVKKVFGVEPIPFLHKKLVKIFPNFSIHNLALSKEKSRVKLSIPESISGLIYTRATIVPVEETDKITYTEIEVNTHTLDLFCEEQNIKPDFIKIDVEGAENMVLEGADYVIKTLRPAFMIEIEVRSNSMYEETFGRFLSANYQCLYMDGNSYKVHEFVSINGLQEIKDFGTTNYVNNFIFVPAENTTLINSLKQYELR